MGSYIRGAVQALQEDFVLKIGLNALVSGKLPIGGLISSAALTTAYLMALCELNHIEFTKYDLIKYSHWVETEFIGLKNGILDQSANILSLDKQIMVMFVKNGNMKCFLIVKVSLTLKWLLYTQELPRT